MIRIANNEDVISIQRLNKELTLVLNELKPDIYNVDCFSKEFIISMINTNDTDYILAIENEMIIGYVLIEKRVAPSEEYKIFKEDSFAYIYEIVVLPEYRKMGYGKQLIEEANKWAKDRDLTSIELNVLYNNYNAISFYECMKFDSYQMKLRKIIE